MVHRHDTASAGPGGEVGELGETSSLILKADEPEAGIALGVRVLLGRVADNHAEALVHVSSLVSVSCPSPQQEPKCHDILA